MWLSCRRLASALAALFLIASPARAAPRSPSAPKAAARSGLMPEGFAGRERAVMTALFPRWAPGTERTGNTAGDGPESARLREAKRWTSGSRTFLLVLVDVWSGPRCDTGATCEPQPIDVALFEQRSGSLVLVGHASGAAHHGGGTEGALDPQPRRLNHDTALIGLRETSHPSNRVASTLRLYVADEKSINVVFERQVEDTAKPARGRKPAGCSAAVLTDAFGTPPFPLKITEHCTQTGKTSTELWRWNGTRYVLHGPASDAALADDDFTKVVDEPSE